MAKMASLVDLTTDRLAFDQSGVRDHRTNLQLPSTGPSLLRGIIRRGATYVNCAPKLGKMQRIFAGAAQGRKARAERCAMGWNCAPLQGRARALSLRDITLGESGALA
jgi:hypothetical protein